ncbi:MAG TPA: TetR/AcrR family transcriptional regulator [Vineibacter sp.]|nr:TetR/AcrR family transcriptional regulator [Vineibacter sp.]
MTQRILETSDRLFYHQGIRAVGVDMIAAEAGISKRSLYDYFASKDDLIVAYLAHQARRTAASDVPSVEQILGVFDWLERWFDSGKFRGCPFVNAVTELGDPKHPASVLAATYKRERRAWARQILSGLGVADAEGLAMQIMILVDGAMATMLVHGDPKVARAAKAAARSLLVAAGVRVPPAPARRARSRDHGRGSGRKLGVGGP